MRELAAKLQARHDASGRAPTTRTRSRCWRAARPMPSRPTTCCSTACIAQNRRAGPSTPVVGDFLSYDPYGIMFRKGDAQLAALVDDDASAPSPRTARSSASTSAGSCSKLPSGEQPRPADEPAARGHRPDAGLAGALAVGAGRPRNASGQVAQLAQGDGQHRQVGVRCRRPGRPAGAAPAPARSRSPLPRPRAAAPGRPRRPPSRPARSCAAGRPGRRRARPWPGSASGCRRAARRSAGAAGPGRAAPPRSAWTSPTSATPRCTSRRPRRCRARRTGPRRRRCDRQRRRHAGRDPGDRFRRRRRLARQPRAQRFDRRREPR